MQTGWGRWGQQWLESPFNGALILAGTCAVLFQAATAGPEQWSAFLKMFDESRFEHVTILDFSSLLLLAPYWVLNDAGQRQWESRCTRHHRSRPGSHCLAIRIHMNVRETSSSCHWHAWQWSAGAKDARCHHYLDCGIAIGNPLVDNACSRVLHKQNLLCHAEPWMIMLHG